ncbi:MAG: hypothetical protein ACR2KT_03240 [Methylocella sp.]
MDWRAGEIVVVHGKANCTERLPLPTDVGEAVAAYLRHGRPASAHGRTVFVRIKPPHHALTSGAVTQIVAHAAERCGFDRIYAHRLRHTRRHGCCAVDHRCRRSDKSCVTLPSVAPSVISRSSRETPRSVPHLRRGSRRRPSDNRDGPRLGDTASEGSKLGGCPAFGCSPLRYSLARDRPRDRGAADALAAVVKWPGHTLPVFGVGYRSPDRRSRDVADTAPGGDLSNLNRLAGSNRDAGWGSDRSRPR